MAIVSFNSNGGSPVPSQDIHFTNPYAIKPSDPIKSGYVLVDWYIDQALTTPYDFSQEVTEDITLYAKWQLHIITTPADSAGELFISNMCGIRDNKISILDKIFRLTELFDPDLMPIELIQNYAENLGYDAGINRSKIITDDAGAQELEQKRYLRFMIRNLPEWYQIKSSKSSVKIMMYSFGLLGDFVYYYTKCYSDSIIKPTSGIPGIDVNLCNLTDDSNTTTIIPIGEAYAPCTSAYNNCDYITLEKQFREDGVLTSKEIAELRSCLAQYLKDGKTFFEKVSDINGIDNNDWVLTKANNVSLDEDISNIKEDEGYFSSPHFKLWVDIEGSFGNYSSDYNRQEMIITAINAIKPINTVFDGVAVYWKAKSNIYRSPISRIRKCIKIISDEETYVF